MTIFMEGFIVGFIATLYIMIQLISTHINLKEIFGNK
jgi:hypothetical protein